MRIFTFSGTVVRIHPMFLIMLAPLIWSGEAHFLFLYIVTLLLHEAGHYFAARKLRIQVAQLEFTPFGGSMQIDLPEALPPGKAFVLSAAGPAINLLCLLFGSIVYLKQPAISEHLLCFLSLNAIMLLTNLLPVLPLDGGRMVLAFLSHYICRALLLRALLALGRILAIALILGGLYITYTTKNALSPCFLGVYLLYASAIEEKNSTSRYLAAYIARRVRLDKRAVLPIQHLAAAADMPLFMLLPHLRPGAYHVITILDTDASTPLGLLHEDTLIAAALTSCSRTLGELPLVK